MTTVATYDVAKGSLGEREFSADLGEKPLYRTMKEVIVQCQANRRQGDAHTKVRSELAGHKKKPWKQKKKLLKQPNKQKPTLSKLKKQPLSEKLKKMKNTEKITNSF